MIKHDLKKTEILKTAARVFRAKGYHATRIQDVADALGMQKGSLYYYISTKEDLLKGLVEDILGQSVHLLNNIGNESLPPAQKLRLCIKAHLTLFHENIDAFGVFIHEDLQLINRTSHTDIFNLLRSYEEGWLAIFNEGIKRGEFYPDKDYKMVVKGLLGMLNWTYKWYHIREGLSIEHVGDVFTDLILYGTSKPAFHSS